MSAIMTQMDLHPMPHRHSVLEDAHALLLGPAMCALGIRLLTQAGVITGPAAGRAV